MDISLSFCWKIKLDLLQHCAQQSVHRYWRLTVIVTGLRNL